MRLDATQVYVDGRLREMSQLALKAVTRISFSEQVDQGLQVIFEPLAADCGAGCSPAMR